MSESNALAVSTKSVIAEIIERLAAITPEQFIEPNTKPDKDYHAVGEAGDDLKRLLTLRNIVADEHNRLGKPLAVAVEKIHREMKLATANKDKVAALQKIVELEDDPETVQLAAEMARKRQFHDIVDKIFWLEVRWQFPELADKPEVSVRKNWTVGWCEKDDSEALGDIFGDDDRLGVPPGFLEFLHSQSR